MQKIISLLNSEYKKKGAVLIGLMLIGIFLELLGLGLILPLLKLISSENILIEYPEIKPVLDFLGNPGHKELIYMALVFLIVVYVAKGCFLVFLAWRQSAFAYGLAHSLATTLHRKYLHKPYVFHLRTNSAGLIQNLTNEVSQLTGATTNLLLLLTEVAAIVGILVLLFAVNPLGALSVMLLFGLLAFIFQKVTKHYLVKWGNQRLVFDGIRIETLIQSFSGIKDIFLLRKREFFLNRYAASNLEGAKLNQRYTTLQQVPRLWFEVIGVLGMVIIIFIAVLRGQSMQALIPSLAIFLAAAFRIIPSLNRIVAALQTLKYAQPSIEILSNELKSVDQQIEPSPGSKVVFEKEIHLSSLKFSHEGMGVPFLDLDIRIPLGAMVGFIGTSGAGKSTLVDILLGLLTLDEGKILVDGVNINENMPDWQKQIGYVPQSIYFLDDTLRNNIAFGVPPEKINEESVQYAIKMAQLESFVEGLENGLDTRIGENGMRISGGQRQRIGIARALYNNPEVLVLDEATSALDNETEDAIIQSIQSLHGKKTIIIIAHRLRSVEICDYLYELDKGKVIAEGSFSKVFKGVKNVR